MFNAEDVMDLIIGFVMYSMFLVAGILLIHNKAHFLIAGFNTASKEEKENYDAKKLSTVTGTSLLIIANVLLNFVLGIHYMPEFKTIYTIIFISVVVSASILVLVLAHTWCKRK